MEIIMNKPQVDPFTLEIIKESLVAIGDEMFLTVQRTSMSTVIYEVLDFAVGITDKQGRLITQGNGVTLFLGTLDYAVRAVMTKFGVENLHPGDIFIINDPYGGGGTHLSDVTIVQPLFFENQIAGFAANKAHWTEVGGANPGSWSTTTTEIYQEGLQFPTIKIFDRGEPIQSVIDIIEANVRTPNESLGDMFAQVASTRVAERRLQEICAKYGLDVVESVMNAWLDYTEELTRQELRKIPDGVYTATDRLDYDGKEGTAYEVCVKVTKTADKIICDFTGSHSQVDLPFNLSYTGLVSSVRAALMALTDPSIPASAGCFRVIEVICPPRTIFTVERPKSVGSFQEPMSFPVDLVWHALAPVIPHRLTAGHFLSVCATIVAGQHPDTGELFLLVEPQAGGWGAGFDKDGENGMVCVGDGETYIIPIEVCEARYGVLVDQYKFDITDGGMGEYRGGRGLVRDYRVTSEEAFYTGIFSRAYDYPWGLAGGQKGSPNYFKFISTDGSETGIKAREARYPVKKNEVIRLVTGTGGGYGNPLKRTIEKVQDDVKNGYITIEHAEKYFGVTLDPTTLELIRISDERKRQ
jgi:N-methylhydantoinase B